VLALTSRCLTCLIMPTLLLLLLLLLLLAFMTLLLPVFITRYYIVCSVFSISCHGQPHGRVPSHVFYGLAETCVCILSCCSAVLPRIVHSMMWLISNFLHLAMVVLLIMPFIIDDGLGCIIGVCIFA